MRSDHLPANNGDEHDVLGATYYGWRRYYKYTQRAGVCAAAKNSHNRRVRRDGKQIIRKELCTFAD